MKSFHDAPKDAEDVKEIRKAIAKQCHNLASQGLEKIVVSCAECGNEVSVYYGAFRCFYCGLYFCRKCSEKHFGKVEDFFDIAKYSDHSGYTEEEPPRDYSPKPVEELVKIRAKHIREKG